MGNWSEWNEESWTSVYGQAAVAAIEVREGRGGSANDWVGLGLILLLYGIASRYLSWVMF